MHVDVPGQLKCGDVIQSPSSDHEYAMSPEADSMDTHQNTVSTQTDISWDFFQPKDQVHNMQI